MVGFLKNKQCPKDAATRARVRAEPKASRRDPSLYRVSRFEDHTPLFVLGRWRVL
jgi:glutamyl/glutaminyl-tRNA synthetase